MTERFTCVRCRETVVVEVPSGVSGFAWSHMCAQTPAEPREGITHITWLRAQTASETTIV